MLTTIKRLITLKQRHLLMHTVQRCQGKPSDQTMIYFLFWLSCKVGEMSLTPFWFSPLDIIYTLIHYCRSSIPRVHSPEWNLRSRNYLGRKSELCIVGIEKRLVYFQDVAGLTAVNNVRLTRLIAILCSFLTETVVLTGWLTNPDLREVRTAYRINTGTQKYINKCRNTEINVV